MNPELFRKLKDQSFKNRFEQADDRILKLQKLQSWINNNETQICDALFSDFKKPKFETQISEIMLVQSELKFFIRNLKKWISDQFVPTPINLIGHKSFVRYENKGLVLIISPWNYPFQLAINPLIAAIAAGNTVVLKPSEFTPFTSKILQNMCAAVFTDDEVVIELGDKEKTNELLGYQFDHVFFTGSTSVGKIIAVQCANKLIPYTLELGGKSPVIITGSADMDDAIRKIHWGKYLNRGQTCVAPDYILIDERLKSDFIHRFNQYTQSVQSTSTTSDRQISNIISDNHKKRLNQLSAVAFDFNTTDVALVEIQNADHTLMKDEIFGPISPVISYKNISDAVEITLKHPNPLALYIFCENKSEIDYLLRSIPSGGVGINAITVHLANHHLPFGGRGNSGQGKYHGYHGFLEFSHHRSVIRQFLFKKLIRILFPPYSRKKIKALGVLKLFS